MNAAEQTQNTTKSAKMKEIMKIKITQNITFIEGRRLVEIFLSSNQLLQKSLKLPKIQMKQSKCINKNKKELINLINELQNLIKT